jgi:hypothetical protein
MMGKPPKPPKPTKPPPSQAFALSLATGRYTVSVANPVSFSQSGASNPIPEPDPGPKRFSIVLAPGRYGVTGRPGQLIFMR